MNKYVALSSILYPSTGRNFSIYCTGKGNPNYRVTVSSTSLCTGQSVSVQVPVNWPVTQPTVRCLSYVS